MAHDNKNDTTEEKEIVQEQAAPPKRELKDTHKHVWQWALANKKLSIPLAGVLVVGLLAALPWTRFALAGTVLRQQLPIVVIDSETNKPVSGASVMVRGITLQTDNQGRVSPKVAVGGATAIVSKQYYKATTAKVVVPILKAKSTVRITLEATGRQVPITVVNRISGKPVSNALVKALNTQVRTDSKGQAVMVVPSGTAELAAAVSAEGYNQLSAKLKVTTAADPANTFGITPSGKVYFLSNQSGKIDVVKANLDGSDRKVVLAGTGKETKTETVLLAARDWKYLALLSRRDGGDHDKLFLISTADDSVLTMDEGKASFSLVGWEDHRFVYTVNRTELKEWEPKKQALKSFDADSKKLATLDQTEGQGSNAYDYVREIINAVYAREGRLLYAKNWQAGFYSSGALSGKQVTFNSMKPDGSDKKVLKTFTPDIQQGIASIQLQPYGPNELYIHWKDSFFEYEDGKIKDLPDATANEVYGAEYATYLTSPANKQTFWAKDRDGKLVFSTGDLEGEDARAVATLSGDYQVYGWYTDDYLLISKKGSELFIMPVTGAAQESNLFKVTDYYRPLLRYYGYGGGYGGL